jgi:hypothetical protein
MDNKTVTGNGICIVIVVYWVSNCVEVAKLPIHTFWRNFFGVEDG